MRTLADSKLKLLAAALAVLGATGCEQNLLPPGDLASDGAQLTAEPPQATVVLVHGMGGFRNIGPVDYFFHVPGLWQRLGARVYVAAETSVASIEERAGELRAQLDAIEGPLLLVGHSQGGLDARYLVSRLGYAQRVRAVVTVAAPHHGSPVADVLLGLAPGALEDAADALIGLLGWSLDGAREVTTSYMDQTFNPSVPDAPGVAYWSFAGRASPLGLQRGSGWLHAPLLPTWTILQAEHLNSDGIVPLASARWGTYLGEIPGDHMGEVNQPLGETPGFAALSFYTHLLQRLHDAGF
jgi:triacylglycerol lipase